MVAASQISFGPAHKADESKFTRDTMLSDCLAGLGAKAAAAAVGAVGLDANMSAAIFRCMHADQGLDLLLWMACKIEKILAMNQSLSACMNPATDFNFHQACSCRA